MNDSATTGGSHMDGLVFFRRFAIVRTLPSPRRTNARWELVHLIEAIGVLQMEEVPRELDVSHLFDSQSHIHVKGVVALSVQPSSRNHVFLERPAASVSSRLLVPKVWDRRGTFLDPTPPANHALMICSNVQAP